jgi:hypothetical protein
MRTIFICGQSGSPVLAPEGRRHLARVGLDVLQPRSRRAVQVQHQRQQHADVDGELEVQRQRRGEGGHEHCALRPADAQDLGNVVEVEQPQATTNRMPAITAIGR